MKTLVHYTLEGRISEGANQVWVCLGTFSTQAEAQTASSNINMNRCARRYDQSRIIALFRDPTGGYPQETPVTRSVVPAPKSDVFNAPVTVA